MASDQGFYLRSFRSGLSDEFRSTISCLAFMPLTCAFSRPLRNFCRGRFCFCGAGASLDAASAGQCCGGFTSFGARSLGRCADSKISLTQKSGAQQRRGSLGQVSFFRQSASDLVPLGARDQLAVPAQGGLP